MNIELGPGTAYIGPLPRCPAHGQMHHDFRSCQWVCPGWDGEGCDYVVTDEEVIRDAKPIGTTFGGAIELKVWPDG